VNHSLIIAAGLGICVLAVSSRAHSQSVLPELSQDEARRENYCSMHTEAERIEFMKGLRQRNDESAQIDIDYIERHCPPSQEALRQAEAADQAAAAQDASRYAYIEAIYGANGQFQESHYGLIFNSAGRCDHYVQVRMADSLNNSPVQVRQLSESVVATTDETEFKWFGCVHPHGAGSAAFAHYLDVNMDDNQARLMKRIPGF
jgi:hypothetical protein